MPLRFRSRQIFRLLALFLWGLTCAGTASAFDHKLQVGQYQHTAWLARDGAPTGIHAIAQTDDGMLWVGAEDGLYRFDGQTFELVPTPGGTTPGKSYVYSLVAQPGGALWVGFRRGGGLGLLKDGKFTRLPATLKQDVNFMAADSHGVLWVQLTYKLYRVQGTTLQAVGAEQGVPAKMNDLVVDRTDTVWICDTDDRLYRRAPGETKFTRYVERFPVAALTLDPRGGVWGSNVDGTWYLKPGPEHPEVLRQGPKANFFGTMMFDREGGLWLQRVGGLSREADPTITLGDDMSREDSSAILSADRGLSSETIYAMFQDRDGNVWTGTTKGLDRFRRTALTPVKLPRRALSYATAPADNGSVWAANWSGTLMKVSDSGITEFPGVGPGTKFVHSNPRDGVWVGGGGGVWHSADGVKFEHLPLEQSFISDAVRDAQPDGSGGVWIAGGGGAPLVHIVDGKTIEATPANGFSTQGSPRCLTRDDKQRIWACAGPDPLLIEGETARRLSTMATGLNVGVVTSVLPCANHVWFAGYTGVALFDGRRVVGLKRKDGASLGEVGGVVELANGDVWMHNRTAALRIPAADVKAILAGGDGAVDVETLDEADGLYGTLSASSPLPSLLLGNDGRLWLATDAGLAWLDPAVHEKPLAPPPLLVRTLLADGKTYDLASAPLLAPENKHVELTYSATALSIPGRVRFRYRLDGIDNDWQEAGLRRTAYFSNLPPGDYTFRVKSTDETGRWISTEARISFRVAKAWYQTAWFHLACAALALLLVWALVRLRERQVTRQVMAREHARQLERNRIARDLHDTFLQSVQGLMWQFQALLGRMPSEDPFRAQLDQAVNLANRVVVEGRDRVKGLRQGSGETRPLADELREVWADAQGGDPRQLQVEVHGRPRALREEIHGEVFQILREALINAHTHAHASKVTLNLNYLDDRLVAKVIDDGAGLADEVLAGGRPGHWGLTGMRERAAEIGANLAIHGAKGVGTTVDLCVIGKRVFEESPAR